MSRAIVFDFDGVIADTADILFALSRDFDPTISEEDFKAHHDGNVYEEPRIQFTPEGAKRLYKEYCNRLSVGHIKNAIEPIKRLSNDYRLFIISSNEEKGIHSVLDNAGIKDCFEAVYGYNTHKSKITKFEMIRDKFDIELEKAIFVTDTLGDIKEAKKLNIPTIAETFGFHNRERLEQGEPHVIVDTWEEIEVEIEKIK